LSEFVYIANVDSSRVGSVQVRLIDTIESLRLLVSC